ncbi:hypothetical protein B6S44_29080 [Bosea sp. Tri-44]|nr:hypothetical protein B6S44_29080 [Bosea sp. Tri-44]
MGIKAAYRIAFRRSRSFLRSIDPNDAARLETYILAISVEVWIGGVICKNARLADPKVMRPMVVPMNPEFRLKLFNHTTEI